MTMPDSISDSIPEPPLAATERIDEICLRYEDDWLRGAQPKLEAFVEQVEPEGRAALVYELLRIDLAYGGPKRELLSESAYLRRLPQFRDVIHIAFRHRQPRRAIRPLQVGQRIGSFVVERELGRGGFGAVYLAHDETLERKVAIKTLHPDLASDAARAERLMDEGRLAAALEHEGVASIHSVETDEQGRPLLICQYVEGESLRQRMLRETLDPDALASLFSEVAGALQHAHEHGVVHCDLQPANILLDANDRPVITDFGLAAHDWLRPPREGEVAGSPPYLAPEQTIGDARQLDARTDIWAVGVMLYEGLTGQRPFVGESLEEILQAVREYDPPPPEQLNPAAPAELSAICMRCLRKSPHDRYATAQQLGDALREAVDPPLQRRRVAAAIGLAALLLAPSLAMLFGPERKTPTPTTPLSATSTLLLARDGFLTEVGGPHAPAVGDGDRVRFQVELNRPAYLYVVWIDGEGKATPVYPWTNGDWSNRPQETPQRGLGLPREVGDFWVMNADRDATETVVVLARSTPLPRLSPTGRWFADLPAQPPIRQIDVVRFDNGLIQLADPADRSPDLENPDTSNHGVLLTQRRLLQRLRPHFQLIHSYCFRVFP